TYLHEYAQDVFQKKWKYDYEQHAAQGEVKICGEAQPPEKYLDWEKVVFHMPTKPISKAANPSRRPPSPLSSMLCLRAEMTTLASDLQPPDKILGHCIIISSPL
ncbi:hypothetical protein BGX26_007028, partial [Mortierella sp. AD094]